jgi:hypothetical protein
LVNVIFGKALKADCRVIAHQESLPARISRSSITPFCARCKRYSPPLSASPLFTQLTTEQMFGIISLDRLKAFCSPSQ